MWEKDSVVEQLLSKLGIKYSFVQNIPINKLQVRASLKNNARFGEPIDPTHATLMTHNMKQGDKYPAPVLDADYCIIGGNHRVNSARTMGRNTVDAYICSPEMTEEQRIEFMRRDNLRHGKALTEEQKVEACVEEYRKGTKTQKQLNEDYFGGGERTYTLIGIHCRAKDIEEKLQSKHVDVKNLNVNAKASLNPIADNMNVLAAAGTFANDYSLTVVQIDNLVKQVSEKQTEDEKLEFIKEEKKALVASRTGKKKTKPEVSLSHVLSKCVSALKTGNDGAMFPSIDRLTADKESRKELKAKANEIINLCKMLKERS